MLIFKEYNNNHEIKKLYKSAFPLSERAPFRFLASRAKKGKAKFFEIYDKEKFVGLTYIIEYRDTVYVFYLAIAKAMRGQGYGKKILNEIQTRYDNYRISLMIEEVVDNAENIEERKKRKMFYERNGFKNTGFKIKEGSVIYDMLYYGENISADEYMQLMKNYMGNFVFDFIYKRIAYAICGDKSEKSGKVKK